MALSPLAVTNRMAEAKAKSRREKTVDRSTERVQHANKRLNKLCKFQVRGLEKEEVHTMCLIDIEKTALLKELREMGGDFSPVPTRHRKMNTSNPQETLLGAPVRGAQSVDLNIEHTSKVIAVQTALERASVDSEGRPSSMNSNNSRPSSVSSNMGRQSADGNKGSDIVFQSVSVTISGKQVQSIVAVGTNEIKCSGKQQTKILETVRNANFAAENGGDPRRRAFRAGRSQSLRSMSAPAVAESHADQPPLSDIKEDFLWQDADLFKRSKQQKRSANAATAKDRHGFKAKPTPVVASNDTSGDTGRSGFAAIVRRQRPALTRSKTWAGSLSIELLNRKPTQTPPLLKSAYHFPSLVTDQQECQRVLHNLKATYTAKSSRKPGMEKSTLMYLKRFDQTRANERLATKVDAFILSHSDRRNDCHGNDDDVDIEVDL